MILFEKEGLEYPHVKSIAYIISELVWIKDKLVAVQPSADGKYISVFDYPNQHQKQTYHTTGIKVISFKLANIITGSDIIFILT